LANLLKGSARQGWASTADGNYLDIRPPAPSLTNAEEWRVLAIHAPETASIEVYRTDGSNEELIASNTGGFANYQWVVGRDNYLRVKNVSGSTVYLGYDAYVSMEEN
jgi:hypothetical protein